MAKLKEQISAMGECVAEVDNILDDIGIGEKGTAEALEVRAATRAFIIQRFKMHLDCYGVDEPCLVRELEGSACDFILGYEACLEKHCHS